MPLVHSRSDKAFKANVKTLMHEVGESPHVKSRAQALAIAYETKRRARAEGGGVFEGPIVSSVPGRTDKHPIDVAAGSYVLPSESISSLGENNTLAGLDKIKKIGAHGLKKLVHSAHGAKDIIRKHRASGGGTRSDGSPVPIVAAGGEHVLTPQEVAVIGDGDVTLGHRLLDNWVVQNRKKHIDVLKKLAPPAKD